MPTGTYIRDIALIDDSDSEFNLSNNVLSYSFDYSLEGYYVPRVVKTSGAASKVNRNINPISSTATWWKSYADVFYNHIWLLPSSVDLTGAPALYSTNIVVWNSYFVSKTLSTVTPTGLSGVNLAGTVPETIPALGTRTFTLSLSAGAPASISGYYTFTFSDAEDPVLTVAGTLALVFPFRHDWSSEWLETYGLKTGIIESHNGYEQRYKLSANPRRTLQMNVLLAEGDTQARNAQMRALFHNMMAYGRGKSWLVPVWSDAQNLGYDLPSGSSTITMSTDYLDIKNDGYLIIYNAFDDYEVVTVDSFTSNSVTLAAPTSKTWLGGCALVPALQAIIPDETISGEVITYDVERHNLTWAIRKAENETINKIAAYTPTAFYNGYPVFFDEHNFTEDPSVDIYSPNRLLDYEVGEVLLDPRYQFTKVRTTYTYLLRDRAAISNFLGFFRYLNGKHSPFWIPTYAKDIQVVNSGVGASSSIDITYIGYASFIKDDPRRRDLILIKPDGSYITRRIEASTDNGNGTETLSLDQPIGFDWTPASFRSGHFLRLVRLDQDSLEVSYDTNHFGQAGLVVVDNFETPS